MPGTAHAFRNTKTINVAVIGSGQAGPSLATAFASAGESVVLFEGDVLGGSCVNTGCTPTKTLRKSARVAHLMHRAAEFGVLVNDVSVDFPAVMTRVNSVVNASRTGLGNWIASTENLTLVREWARLDGRDDGRFVVRAGSATYLADRVYLNVGTHAVVPSIPGVETVGALVNDTVLALHALPPELIIVGGSYIGLELGQMFQRLGSRVTIIERSAHVISSEDADVSERLEQVLRDEGISIVVNARIRSITGRSGELVSVVIVDSQTGASRTVSGSHLLLATGRAPNTGQLGLETIGITVDAQGFVPVNGALQTNIEGVWAVGDVNRRGAFTHTSYQDHEIVLDNYRGGTRTADGRIPTFALFTDPPMGRVGISETEARRKMRAGKTFLMAVHEMQNVSRAKEESELAGVIKVLVDAATNRFAGATVLGFGGDEVVQAVSAQMAANAPYQVLRDFLPIHPTVTEFFPTILGKLKPLQ